MSSTSSADRTGLDPRGAPVSYADAAALAAYEEALHQFQTYTGNPIAAIDATLERFPDFVLAHLFRCANYALAAERRFVTPAVDALDRANALLDQANERESLLAQALRYLVVGKWAAASLAFDAVLQAYPRDIFALQAAHLLDFFRGDALNLRNRPSRVLPDWSPEIPGYSYIKGMYAFGLEEANEYSRAEDQAREALALDPVDAWSVHALVHVFEMQARAEEGIEFLESRVSDWAPDNTFAYHNWWHLGLMYLEKLDDSKVLDILDTHIVEDVGDFAMGLVDVTAMLWRLQLLGVDVGSRMQSVARVWADKLDGETGFYAFNDFHAALAFAGADQPAYLETLLLGAQRAIDDDGSDAGRLGREIGVPLVKALSAYRQAGYEEAVELLLGVRDIANRFGGSHAQRDIINLTLLAAAHRSGKDRLVRYLMNEREMAKPNGILGRRVIEGADRG